MGREKGRKSISSVDLTQVLEAVHKEIFIKKTGYTTFYAFEMAGPFLKDRGLEDHVLILHQGINWPFPPNSDRNLSETDKLIFRNLVGTRFALG